MTEAECVLAYLAICEEGGGSLNDAIAQATAYGRLTPEQRLDMAAEIGPPPRSKRPNPT